MIRSMTGFGSAEGSVGPMHVSVEIRSVNHRFFNPSIKLPPSLTRYEPEVRDALRKAVNRGHVTLTARVDQSVAADTVIDDQRFAAYVSRLRELKKQHALDGPIDLATVLRLPNVVSGEPDAEAGSPAELVTVVEGALAAFTASRDAEGRRLATFLGE